MAIEPGAELGPWALEEVGGERVAELAILLDDANPIHLDPAAAQAAGLGDRPIAQGPASIGYVFNMLRASLPGSDIADLRVRLLANVFVGDGVVAAGRVESVDDRGPATRIGCSVWLDVVDGPRALEGTAALIQPPAGAARRPA